MNTEKWLPFSPFERMVIGKLCRWHNYGKWLENGSKKEESVYFAKEEVRVQLLVELIQLSDFYHHVVDVTWKNFPTLQQLEKDQKLT